MHRYVTVCLKNSTRLCNLIKWLQARPQRAAKLRILVIDETNKELTLIDERLEAAINETGAEATVLMYLVSIDNKRTAKERMAVLKYIRERLPHLDYKDEQMNDYLISLAPDDESFSMAFHRCLKKGKLVVEPLLQAVLNVITADGVVHEKERAFLAKLIDWLKQDGYEIDTVS